MVNKPQNLYHLLLNPLYKGNGIFERTQILEVFFQLLSDKVIQPLIAKACPISSEVSDKQTNSINVAINLNQLILWYNYM